MYLVVSAGFLCCGCLTALLVCIPVLFFVIVGSLIWLLLGCCVNSVGSAGSCLCWFTWLA